MRATIDDLDDVEGVGETRAKAIKEGLPAWPRPRSSSATPELRCTRIS
jgi:hypothetical protein